MEKVVHIVYIHESFWTYQRKMKRKIRYDMT